ncbi:MAG: translation initiation factor [Opitutae bacterium]|nr:translation initiation factor [Opitutae bacterium]
MGNDKAKDGRISTDAVGTDFGSNPFDSLSSGGLRKVVISKDTSKKVPTPPRKSCGHRLDVRREKSGRGGKTVTTVKGFPPGVSWVERKEMLRDFKKRLGTGGVFADGQWEIQGDKRDEVVVWLQEKGYQPILSGG